MHADTSPPRYTVLCDGREMQTDAHQLAAFEEVRVRVRVRARVGVRVRVRVIRLGLGLG